MSLNYDKSKEKLEGSDNMWSSYSDLFMVLSLVFLLLYVVSSLRNGTENIYRQVEYQKLSLEAEDLREQNRVYNTLKTEYLETQANQNEQEIYENLMDKLKLLKDEAKQEKESLRMAALENEQKEEALNQYQQIVRNIINANMLAKAGLKRRDETIEEKREALKVTQETLAVREQILAQTSGKLQETQENLQKNKQELEQKTVLIAKLEENVESKKDAIDENKKRIEKIESLLSEKITELKKSEQDKKISKSKLEQQIQKLQKMSADKIGELESRNQEYESELTQTTTQLQSASQQLAAVSSNLEKTESEKQQLTAAMEQEKARLTNELRDVTEQYKSQMDGLKASYEQQMAEQEKQFSEGLKKAQLSAAEKAQKQAEFAKANADKAKELQGKLASLSDKVKESEKRLQDAEKEGEKFREYIAGLEKVNEELAEDLKASNNIINQKKQIAKAMQNELKSSGLDIDVDGRTGDVILSFGDEYFDTGKAELKPNMEKTLQKFMPVYAKSLFKDAAIADNIESVEIVGFSSPTYGGKYIDPTSLSQQDRTAVNYNLDLSYRRARSIFQYIFDTKKMSYDNQKKLLPIVKVTGRSFLAEGVKGRDAANGLDTKTYCAKHDCKKAQKVIIKFNLKN